MSHEHVGECCGAHQEMHEHHHDTELLAAHLGSLCCSGHCPHPEHQAYNPEYMQQLNQLAEIDKEDEDEDGDSETLPGTKKKKKKVVPGVVRLQLVAA